MSRAIVTYIGLWLFSMTIALFLTIGLYLFADNSKDVVEELTYATIYHTNPKLGEFIKKGTSGKAHFINALKDNKLVSDLRLDTMNITELMLERENDLYFTEAVGSDIAELDDYIEDVRLTFTYDSKKQVTADFIISKRKLFFFIGDNKTLGIKPWARFITLDRVKISEL